MMAPEVLRGLPYGHEAEMWSLGCLYYEMLTGFPPFTGKTYEELLDNIARGTYQIPKTIKLSTEGFEFLNSLLTVSTIKRLNWKVMLTHEYLQKNQFNFLENHQDAKLDENMHLSTINTKEFTHKDLMNYKNGPYEWMKANKAHTHVLNAANSDNFEKIYHAKLNKYFDYLDKMNANAANRLGET